MFLFRVALYFFVVLYFFSVGTVFAGQNPDLASPSIIINLPSRTLEFYSGSNLVKVYPIAIGKPSTPSPLGSFSIINKEVNPWWFPPKGDPPVPSGPDNPLGYRWMGFLPLYGIHGTNAPWAIGGAVSNGCIRMLEEDVEELFEVVPYGTPVRLTYDRVKVFVDSKGQASLGIYPDVYGYGGVSIAEVRAKLAVHGLSGLVSDDFIMEQIRSEPDKQVVFAQMFTMRINDKPLVEQVIYQKGTAYIPVWAVAKAMKVNLTWDESAKTVKTGNFTAPGVVKGDILYVTAEGLQTLFGGQAVVKPEERLVEISVIGLSLNGKPLTSDVRLAGEVLAVPVLPLADAMGHKYQWDPKTGILVIQGKQAPVIMVGEQPYLPITKIYEFLRAYVFWNQPAHSIELTYPFTGKGSD